MTVHLAYDEAQWLKLLFLLADTQQWIDELAKDAFSQLPISNKKQLLRKTYHLTPTAFAHIIERHYYKIGRHPQAGKFHIPIIEILNLLREAAALPATPEPGTLNFRRTLHTPETVGTDKHGHPCSIVTILIGPGGNIITAYPGI